MPQVSFSPKKINVYFSMAQGTFGTIPGNNGSAIGLRVQCHIDVKGGPQNSNATLAIYGMPLSQMNQLTTFGNTFLREGSNSIQIDAGDDVTGMHTIFQGIIWNAYVDGQQQPYVCLRIEARPGAFHNVKPQTPLTFKGATPVATIAQKIAGLLGMSLVNYGVKSVLVNPYFYGDAISMLRKLSEHAGIGHLVHLNKVTIVAPGSSSGNTHAVSRTQGMVAYPILTSYHLIVKAYFDGSILWQDTLQVTSDLTPANGAWTIFQMEYDLESETPHGKWFQTMVCLRAGAVVPLAAHP